MKISASGTISFNISARADASVGSKLRKLMRYLSKTQEFIEAEGEIELHDEEEANEEMEAIHEAMEVKAEFLQGCVGRLSRSGFIRIRCASFALHVRTFVARDFVSSVLQDEALHRATAAVEGSGGDPPARDGQVEGGEKHPVNQPSAQLEGRA